MSAIALTLGSLRSPGRQGDIDVERFRGSFD
jgi:hypothetical protein